MIADVLGCASRRDGYIEGDGWIVSWCVGHLVEPVPPDAYDSRYSKWNMDDLPIIPREWQYQILPATKKQYDILTALMLDERVDSIVSATDAGREGEAIFRLVYRQCGCTKPVKRLWISSMEEGAIRKELENLADSSRYDNLYAAALCRQKADWLIGMNGTRLFTKLYGGKTLRVGRVMTPTLALIADREAAISGFQKEKFYTVELDLHGFQASGERIASKTDAGKLRSACLARDAVVTSVEEREKRENPPKLYDLTALQRDANRLFDYTAKQTLDCLQSLYEKRLATYPRTDSRYLTEDMAPGLPDLCRAVERLLPFPRDEPLTVHAERVTDNAKVSDHHAVIPTSRSADADFDSMPTGEKNILNLLAVRLLCAVGEPYVYTETAVTLECGGASFSAKGRTVISEGWKKIWKAYLKSIKQKPEETSPSLPKLTKGQIIATANASVKEGRTTPPERYSEDTLLAAMERAGAEEFSQIENLERAGLGTPATRADIIEKLMQRGFAERKQKRIVPTKAGLELIRVIPEQLRSVKLTTEWERKLSEVERGTLDPAVFMDEIETALKSLVQEYREKPAPVSETLSQSDRPVIGKCPRCGRNVVDGKSSFFCEGYYGSPQCRFALWKNDRFFLSKRKQMDRKTAAALLKSGRVHMTGLYSERTGGTYDADVVMDDTGGKFVKFKLEFSNNYNGKKGN